MDDWDNDEDWDEEDEFELRELGFPVASKLDHITEAKLNVLDRQGRTEEYLALCQKGKATFAVHPQTMRSQADGRCCEIR